MAELNPFKIAQEQLDVAAERLGLSLQQLSRKMIAKWSLAIAPR